MSLQCTVRSSSMSVSYDGPCTYSVQQCRKNLFMSPSSARFSANRISLFFQSSVMFHRFQTNGIILFHTTVQQTDECLPLCSYAIRQRAISSDYEVEKKVGGWLASHISREPFNYLSILLHTADDDNDGWSVPFMASDFGVIKRKHIPRIPVRRYVPNRVYFFLSTSTSLRVRPAGMQP